MPKLGRTPYSYTPEGIAQYERAKKKKSKNENTMNDIYNRIETLMEEQPTLSPDKDHPTLAKLRPMATRAWGGIKRGLKRGAQKLGGGGVWKDPLGGLDVYSQGTGTGTGTPTTPLGRAQARIAQRAAGKTPQGDTTETGGRVFKTVTGKWRDWGLKGAHMAVRGVRRSGSSVFGTGNTPTGPTIYRSGQSTDQNSSTIYPRIGKIIEYVTVSTSDPSVNVAATPRRKSARRKMINTINRQPVSTIKSVAGGMTPERRF